MLFGASRKSIEYAVSYMNIYAVGTIFVELTLGMNAFITAQGFAKTGQCLRYNRGKSRSFDTHSESKYKDRIKYDIGNRTDHQL